MRPILYFAIFLLLFGFTACEKESYNYVSPSDTGTPEERFDRMQKPLVLFQLAERNLETGKENGWFIDRDGWLRAYERTFPSGENFSPDNTVLAELELFNLYGSTTGKIRQIEKEELYQPAINARTLHQNQLSALTNQPNVQTSLAFFAYTMKVSQEYIGNAAECNNNRSEDYVSIVEINRRIIDLQGPQTRHVTSFEGQELHQWLMDRNAEVESFLINKEQ